MAAPEIQISKDGLKLSYQRYLSDSAAGFLVILIMLLAISNKTPLPFVGHSLESFLISNDIKMFIFLILFLLATPLGLLINGLSWFCLGWCQKYLNNFWFKLSKGPYDPLRPTKEDFQLENIVNFFRINTENNINNKEIDSVASFYEEFLNIFLPERARLEHVIGLSRFARNLSFLSLLSFFSILHLIVWDIEITFCNSHKFLCLSLVVAILFFCLYSLVENYRCLQILSIIYIDCIVNDITNDRPDSPEELVKKIYSTYFGNQSETK